EPGPRAVRSPAPAARRAGDCRGTAAPTSALARELAGPLAEDERRDLARVLDQELDSGGAQLFAAAQAPAAADRARARGAAGLHVDRAVADHPDLARVHAQPRDGFGQDRGVRLAHRERVAAEHGAEHALDAQPLDDPVEETGGLVREHREALLAERL